MRELPNRQADGDGPGQLTGGQSALSSLLAVNPGGVGGLEAGAPGQLQSITHGWGEWGLLLFKAGPRHKC